jgi:very-short-patch-repair endonuclease
LWQAPRSRQLGGAEFRRQRPVGPYIVAFCCLERGLVVEPDGGQHAVQAAADAGRDAWLSRQGLRVLRFWNHDVLNNTEGVLQRIEAALAER